MGGQNQSRWTCCLAVNVRSVVGERLLLKESGKSWENGFLDEARDYLVTDYLTARTIAALYLRALNAL